MANIIIDIASEFTGNKAFNKAGSATDKLTSNVKKLAGAFGLAFGTTQILAFGKAAIKAAAADQKAQKQLALALKNVGLERDAASAEGYIQRIQNEYGIVDDKLRPAYQTLALATRDTGESQKLLNLALDISAATGKDLGSVTAALSKAYLGNTTSLSKLGVGLSKAQLKTKSFDEITKDLQTTFAGSAKSAANTFEGSINKLGVAAEDVKEIIGTGLIDALKGLGDNDSVDNLASSMKDAAEYTADVIRGVGLLAAKLNNIPLIKGADISSIIQLIPILGSFINAAAGAGNAAQIAPKPFTTPMTISGQVIIEDKKKIVKLTKEEAAAQAKILKDKRLAAAIDKANLALNKASDVFDMDKIQIAAALTSQAEQLGKATSASQVLQIANDTARLNVKRDILALEDAIAAKDEAAIVAGTAKLNTDLKILGALTGQNLKLTDIKSILDSLKPVDLINLQNIKDAIALLGQLSVVQSSKVTTAAAIPSISNPNAVAQTITSQSIAAAIAARTGYAISGVNDPRVAYGGQRIDTAGNYNSFNADMAYAMGAGRYQGGSTGTTIVVNTGIGDPNAIAEAIDQVLSDAAQRGTLKGYITA